MYLYCFPGGHQVSQSLYVAPKSVLLHRMPGKKEYVFRTTDGRHFSRVSKGSAHSVQASCMFPDRAGLGVDLAKNMSQAFLQLPCRTCWERETFLVSHKELC